MSQSPSRIVVVRHGETEWNRERRIQGRTEVPLNETGRDQSREVAGQLADAGDWSRIITSPLGRAVETGKIVAEVLGLEFAGTDESLIERNYGEAEGMVASAIAEKWAGTSIPGAESLDAVATRGAAALTRIVLEHPGSIVVSHGSYLRQALKRLTSTDVPLLRNGAAWILSIDADASFSCERTDSVPVRR